MKKRLALVAIVMGGIAMTPCQPESIYEQMGIPEGATLLTTEGYSSQQKISVEDNTVQ